MLSFNCVYKIIAILLFISLINVEGGIPWGNQVTYPAIMFCNQNQPAPLPTCNFRAQKGSGFSTCGTVQKQVIVIVNSSNVYCSIINSGGNIVAIDPYSIASFAITTPFADFISVYDSDATHPFSLDPFSDLIWTPQATQNTGDIEITITGKLYTGSNARFGFNVQTIAPTAPPSTQVIWMKFDPLYAVEAPTSSSSTTSDTASSSGTTTTTSSAVHHKRAHKKRF